MMSSGMMIRYRVSDPWGLCSAAGKWFRRLRHVKLGAQAARTPAAAMALQQTRPAVESRWSAGRSMADAEPSAARHRAAAASADRRCAAKRWPAGEAHRPREFQKPAG